MSKWSGHGDAGVSLRCRGHEKVIADGIIANPGSKHKAETETLPPVTKMVMEIDRDCQLDGQSESPLDLMEIIIMPGNVHENRQAGRSQSARVWCNAEMNETDNTGFSFSFCLTPTLHVGHE